MQVGFAQASDPVTVEVAEASPAHTAVALAIAGGGGALSWTARTAQQLPNPHAVVSAYSWNVQTVWSSLGSTWVEE